ncbi:hypothetical protein CCH79_00016189, partial [Gambusia affinis]
MLRRSSKPFPDICPTDQPGEGLLLFLLLLFLICVAGEMCESPEWKNNLTDIIEDLSKQQYQKMLLYLKKIPKSVKEDDTHREKMAQTIIEYYGEKESIAEIRRIMDEIPRRDSPIQNLLNPFVEKLGKKRKPGPKSKKQQESPSEFKKKKKTESDPDDDDDDDVKAGFEKNNVVFDSDSSDDETQAGDPGSPQSEKIQMKKTPTKKDKQAFELEDGTGSITVDLWGDDTKHLNGISNGDRVRVTNLKTNLYNGRVSLNSTNSTRITKVQSAQVQNVNITIKGISKFDGINAELEVEIKNQVKTLEVSCPILAKAVGLRLDDDFKAKLLKKLELK